MLLAFGRRLSFFALVCLFPCVLGLRPHGSVSKTLYVAEDAPSSRQFVINRYESESATLERSKRDVQAPPPAALQKNISTWTTHLNDSHQQLMVHWVGEGSNVIICLARDSTPRNKGSISSSALFISYDYGKNFTNKTDEFLLGTGPESGYAQLDKFFNHPKYPEFCVFVDSTNKKLYYTSDNGRNIHRTDLTFHPSELAFDEEFPDKFVILDKVDSNRKLYLTLDGGKSFKHIQSYVKTFFWSSGPDFPKAFYVERWKPDGTSTVLQAADPIDLTGANKLFEDAKDFQIKGDFMFATKQAKERNTLDLYISHQRGPFFKAEFQTELDLRKFHIADVTDKRIFVSVLHRETLADLYVSEISRNFTQYNFVLSLEQVLSYFPDGNWKDSWLEDVTEDPFTDLYRVEGLKGIYIASKVDSKSSATNIGPEHLVSLITFDHGVTWSPINAPAEDENGKPLNCHTENSCSLHLCQKFSQLYPVTRSASIMSSKSAPGIIMATGVMGKSLKGIPGVYISRDAGLTWKRILKDYYFFNYGDHGGVLVAVKYFKSRGETRKILYSTNEGIDWNSYQFNADDLRIYGLMTEPGENTTTFTMFGSANDQHQWIIITIDLKNTFARNCTDSDYKFWSPSPPNSSVSCVLGTRDTFQRRLAHSNCYNGISYDRPVKKQVCECGRRDFECDFGFMRSAGECVRNKSVKFDPYAVPKECRPGHFYKRTKGYRKIDGDVCVASGYLSYSPDMIPCPLGEPQEFLIVALRDKIARIDLSNNATVIPIRDQKNIVAIEFDIKNNCLYWADIEMDKIMRQCFDDGSAREVVVDTELASIEGMALDYISNVLFFVDGIRRKIEAVRTDLASAGRMRATILDSKVLSKPRGIAVHPRAGYLFWTDWDRSNPSVSRSSLDGTDVRKLFGKPIVQWPNGITIDQMSEKIFWVDAMEDYIASADLDGKYFRRILWNDVKVTHPFAVAVLKDRMYWDDWKAKSIFGADKDTGSSVITINDSFTGLMDLKVFAHFTQHGSNACSYKNTSCETLCLGRPGNGFGCLCPDGFNKVNDKCMCPNGMEPAPNMTCPKKPGATCMPGQFTCKNGMCISAAWRCDGNNDCGDLSDEVGCQCSPPMIPCDDNNCYLPTWKCDGDFDCADKSDEKECAHTNCTENQFTCASGQCIEKKWVCDGDNDCKDGSDERNCTFHPKRPDTVNCSVNGFACGNDHNALCIPNSWVCDGENDCPGGEDEKDDRCKNSTCAPYMYRCPSGKCIYRSWVCDGENDCSDEDSSDEKNCTNIGIGSKILPRPEKPDFSNSTCLDWMFKCDNGNCLPRWWRCDSIDDCGDNSDEVGCGWVVPETTMSVPEVESGSARCAKNQFSCTEPSLENNATRTVCIPLSWVCDTAEDCADGSDERDCDTHFTYRCPRDQAPCADKKGCVLMKQLCDGHMDCADGSDEMHCSGPTITHKPIVCPAGFLSCEDDTQCVRPSAICDGVQDCYDGADEANCTTTDNDTRYYHTLTLGVDQTKINASSFLVSCWMPLQRNVEYKYLPSIARVGDGVWRNMTWIADSAYRFTGLEPYTNYNVTFYIHESKSNKTYASNKYVNTTTDEGEPSPPIRLTVRQMVGSRVNVIWDAPTKPRGIIQYYTVHFTPPDPPITRTIQAPRNNKSISVTINGYFKPNHNYSFWVTAINGAAESAPSANMTLMFDDIGALDELANVSMTRHNDSAVSLSWHRVPGADSYEVNTRLPPAYDHRAPIRTNHTNVTVTDLPPGVNVSFGVRACKGDVRGEPFTIRITTTGVPDETLNVSAMLLRKTSVQLSWNAPTADRYKGRQLTYEVLYAKAGSFSPSMGLINRTRLETTNTTVLIEGLHACEAYVFAAALRYGPHAGVVEIMTRENAKAPVKNLHFGFNDKKSALEIMWNANCDVIREPVAYRLDITELTKNKVSRYALDPTINTTLKHVIEGIPIGARFNVCVYANVVESAVTCAHASGLPVPAPQSVVAWQTPSGHVVVDWQHPQSKEIDHEYEILLSGKEIPTDLLHPTPDVMAVRTRAWPHMLTVPEASGPLYVSVRVVTPEGYVSDMSEVSALHMDSMAEPQTSAGIYWGAGIAVIVGIALGAALIHALLRHRRLTRSFLRLTAHTPRYDSRRGQATIDHDDDDVPPIHGFSDDEPLVIA